ncbi:TIM21-domain-containing protein [Stachybotrys elegans]|uniref:Mitochondrial import inner membrane translocase subunit Tim21 n=1 Tax=Stachybotrys elegans TaxID=80388 RepID=A0A8K0T189_9HYPO|nr:TIM21-domain-containing protein [Stachybotrys elegans]
MMKITSPIAALRPAASLLPAIPTRSIACPRTYATQNGLGSSPAPGPRRRTVTPFNDDGYVAWKDLSVGEKAARATQQSFNFGLVMVGLVLTGGVGYFLWTDVFSPDSKTAQFNRAVDRIKSDPRCLEILGEPKTILAHGEETYNKWRRARPVSSSETVDGQGNSHLLMHFHVDSKSARGVARIHMIKRRDESHYEYKYFYVDIKGHDRIVLENADASGSGSGRKQLNLFGVKWG